MSSAAAGELLERNFEGIVVTDEEGARAREEYMKSGCSGAMQCRVLYDLPSA